MKEKPARFGLKEFTLADATNGYVLDIIVYTENIHKTVLLLLLILFMILYSYVTSHAKTYNNRFPLNG